MKSTANNKAHTAKWGLFNQSLWRHPIRWLKDFKIYKERIRHLKKYGYAPQAKWETFLWFIDVMREILTQYRYNRVGDPWCLNEKWDPEDKVQEQRNVDFYDAELDKMIFLLDKMDERNYDSSKTLIVGAREETEMQRACNEFFKMFAKYFYGFWD